MRARWQARREGPSHADDWLMTYADMITLLLCFFALFVSVSLTPKNARHHVEVTQVIPPPPSPQSLPQVARAEHVTEDAVPGAPAKPAPVTADVTAKPKPEMPPANAAPKPSEPPAAAAPAKEAPKPPPVETAAVSSTPVTLELPKPIDIPSGDRISTVEMSSAAFFDSGSATLSKGGEAILLDLAAKLQSDPLRDYRITVEGHTDDNPIHTAQFPSNWELSTARAAAVVQYFVEHGIPAQRLRAAGYADTFPKVPNRDASGNPIPANQAQNRRVVIKLERIEKSEPAATVPVTFFPPPELQ